MAEVGVNYTRAFLSGGKGCATLQDCTGSWRGTPGSGVWV